LRGRKVEAIEMMECLVDLWRKNRVGRKRREREEK
jgi:hypothetical protein